MLYIENTLLSQEELKLFAGVLTTCGTYCNPFPSKLREEGLLPWVISTFNAIFQASEKTVADDMANSLVSVNLGSSPNASKLSSERGHVNEDSQWFMSANKPLPGSTAHQRKLDFGLLSVGPDSSGSPVSPEWGTVKVIGEHTDEKELTHDKFLQFAELCTVLYVHVQSI